jgi:hypothetical protein
LEGIRAISDKYSDERRIPRRDYARGSGWGKVISAWNISGQRYGQAGRRNSRLRGVSFPQ